jgi:hypothetical protein
MKKVKKQLKPMRLGTQKHQSTIKSIRTFYLIAKSATTQLHGIKEMRFKSAYLNGLLQLGKRPEKSSLVLTL